MQMPKRNNQKSEKKIRNTKINLKKLKKNGGGGEKVKDGATSDLFFTHETLQPVFKLRPMSPTAFGINKNNKWALRRGRSLGPGSMRGVEKNLGGGGINIFCQDGFFHGYP